MSDIHMMNDSSEIKWGYSIFIEAINRIISERTNDPTLPDLEFLDSIDKFLSMVPLSVHPLLACFSTEGDVLSQWRGYADDGRGICIGFKGSNLENCCATLFKCEYDFDVQVEQIKGRIIAAYSIRDEFPLEVHAMHLFGYLPSLKSSAFREEGEVRAVHLLNVSSDGHGIMLSDPGGTAFGKNCPSQNVEFRIRDSEVIAYIDIPFFEGEKSGTITEVILGPKNPNFFGNISSMLMRYGFKNVNIKRSSAAYR